MEQARPGSRERPRLMIPRLVLENFKSYAGVQEIGPLHKRFSSVVGPNGSGKSNVIDALLFVFGKRAKQLRLNKVSELIHKSAGFPDLEYARVSVHFQEIVDEDDSGDDFEVVPGSEFVITRVAYKNNQSKYMINDRNSSFTEVTQLLMRHGIDLDNNRFLILQGEVEQIAMMKPKGQTPHEEGLLEYLEDIIGSNRYIEEIEAVGKELEAANEVRTEKLNRARISERERDGLFEAKSEAEAYLDQERALRRKKNVLYQICLNEATRNVEEIGTKQEQLAEKHRYEQEKLRKYDEQLTELEKSYEQCTSEYGALNRECQRVETEFTAYERKDIKFQEDQKHMKTQIKKLEKTITTEGQKLAENQATLAAKEQEIPAIQKEIATAERRVASEEAKLEEVMRSLAGETEELRAQLEAKQAQLAPKQSELQALELQQKNIETEMNLLQESVNKARERFATAQTRLNDIEGEGQRKMDAIRQAESDIQTHEARIRECERECKHLEAEEQQLVSRMRDATSRAEEAKAALQSGSGRNRLVSQIMEATRRGGRLAGAGVCGRLGDLGAIDSRYDVAISTACSNLDFIVCETSDGATACINFLRENNLGRATFIALDKLGDFSERMDNPPACPGDGVRLFDLVRVSDPKFRPAFYHGLRDTLVAENLDKAVAMAYEGNKCKWRVVTLDGQLIDTSGTMSGGGQAARKGGMKAQLSSAALSQEEVHQLETVAADADNALRTCRARRRELEQEMHQLKKEVERLQESIPKLRMEAQGLPALRQQLERQVRELRDQCELSTEDQRKLHEHEEAFAAMQKAIAKKKPAVDRLEAEVQQLQQQILDVGGPRLKRQQTKVDEATEAAESARARLSEAEVAVKTSTRNVQKAEAAIRKAEAELETVRAKLEELLEAHQQMKQDALQVKQAYDAAKQAAEAKESQVTEIKERFEELKAQVSKIKSVELDIQNQMEEYERAIKDNRQKQEYWQQQLTLVRRAHDEDLKERKAFAESLSKRVSVAAGHEETKGADESSDEADDDQEAVELDKPLEDHAPEYLARFSKDELKHDINVLEQERDRLKANVNMGALEEYRRKDAEYKERIQELEVATEARNGTRRRHEELRRKRLDEFMAGFCHITLKLKEMYQMITLGGDAELELVDSLDPFSEGIVFSVRPPKKSWKNISNLSGGEKTLSSLALVFALHHFKPTPLYVMDEIDAALDFKNVSIVANYIKERTRDAQFVIISLRNNMFELADRLVGIYKTHDATKSVTISPRLIAMAQPSSKQSTRSSLGPLQDRTNTNVDVEADDDQV